MKGFIIDLLASMASAWSQAVAEKTGVFGGHNFFYLNKYLRGHNAQMKVSRLVPSVLDDFFFSVADSGDPGARLYRTQGRWHRIRGKNVPRRIRMSTL